MFFFCVVGMVVMVGCVFVCGGYGRYDGLLFVCVYVSVGMVGMVGCICVCSGYGVCFS